MGTNRVVPGNSQTEPTVQNKSLQKDRRALENELENRIENFDKLVQSIQGVLEQESFSTKLHAIDLVTDLRMKIKASHEMFRVAKLLREPARESMLLKVRDCVHDLEEVFALRSGVKMS